MKLGAQNIFEPLTYHNQKLPGYFSVHGKNLKAFKSDYFQLPLLPEVIQAVDPTRDSYISQGEFFRRHRAVVNLARIGLSFVDLDTYHVPGLVDDSPEVVVFKTLGFCESEGIPLPSLIVYSGRGYQLKWLFGAAIPRAALPRWNLLQATLIDKLRPLGADPASRDAARILRLVDTVNTKTGNKARVVHVEDYEGEILRYDFDYLCDLLFPLTREELRAKREERKAARTDLIPVVKTHKTLSFFSPQKLSWDRLEDIRFLYNYRGGVPDWERTTNLMWRLNFLLLSHVTSAARMRTEALVLAKEIDPTWTFKNSELGTLYRKALASERGERVYYNGKSYSPFYTPKTETLINIFHITPEEEKVLTTLISKREKYSRQVEKRRVDGVIPRMEYEKNSLSQTRPWEALGIARRTYYWRLERDGDSTHRVPPLVVGQTCAMERGRLNK